jgi:hypothetical protein
VLGHSLLVLGLAILYAKRGGVDLGHRLRQHRLGGILGGIALGAVVVRGVVSQPASAAPAGWGLALAVVWYGVVYGSADAILLTVIPVAVVGGDRGRPRAAAAGLLASLLVTAVYHLGFAEYRGSALVQPLMGNAIITAGYLLTGSPLTPVLGHVIMHTAAVAHGMATTSQLPPHY